MKKLIFLLMIFTFGCGASRADILELEGRTEILYNRTTVLEKQVRDLQEHYHYKPMNVLVVETSKPTYDNCIGDCEDK